MFLNDKRKAVEQVNKKWVRVLTVLIYVISVSLVALVLGLYYRLIWRPNYDFAKDPDQIDAINLNKTISLGTIYLNNSNVISILFIYIKKKFQIIINFSNQAISQIEIRKILTQILIDGLKKQNSFVGISNADFMTSNTDDFKLKINKGISYLFSFKIDVNLKRNHATFLCLRYDLLLV